MNYYIEDFTINNYKRIVTLAKDINVVTSYDEALKDHGIVLRHDIDMSPHRALALSKVEEELNVRAYYFIHLHSEYYNVMERSINDIFREIESRGGIIGLHFEPGYYNISSGDIDLLNEKMIFEKELLEQLVDCEKIGYMSFHNPDIGSWNKLKEDSLGGMCNVYGKTISENFEYCSDSNGYWRFKRLEDLIKESAGKKIHTLTHPFWWQNEPMLPYDRVIRAIEGRGKANLKEYNRILDELGRENVGKRTIKEINDNRR